MPPCIEKSFSVLDGKQLTFPPRVFHVEKNGFCWTYLIFYAPELPRPAGVVQEGPQVEPVVVGAVVFGVIRRGERGHLVSVHGILGEKPLHFVSHLVGRERAGRQIREAGGSRGRGSSSCHSGLCELTAPHYI